MGQYKEIFASWRLRYCHKQYLNHDEPAVSKSQLNLSGICQFNLQKPTVEVMFSHVYMAGVFVSKKLGCIWNLISQALVMQIDVKLHQDKKLSHVRSHATQVSDTCHVLQADRLVLKHQHYQSQSRGAIQLPFCLSHTPRWLHPAPPTGGHASYIPSLPSTTFPLRTSLNLLASRWEFRTLVLHSTNYILDMTSYATSVTNECGVSDLACLFPNFLAINEHTDFFLGG